MPSLTEQYRPRTLEDVVAQPALCMAVAGILKRGVGGTAILLRGPSGMGKTTIAQIIAESVSDPGCIQDCDSGRATPARLAQVEQEARTVGLPFMGRTGKGYIWNECQKLSGDSIAQFLVWLERLPKHVVVVFTTTKLDFGTHKDSTDEERAFVSRCMVLDLNRRPGSRAIAEHCHKVAMLEGLAGNWTADKLERKVKEEKNNFRAVLNFIAAGGCMRASQDALFELEESVA